LTISHKRKIDMTIKDLLNALLILAITLLAACGGGGGGGGAAPIVQPATVQPTTATLELATSGTLTTGTSLAGIGISVILPAGVTVKTNADGSVSTGVVTVSGVAAPGALTPPVYTLANGTAPAKVTFVIASNAPAGFGTGEFTTVVCGITAGSNPKTTDFSLTDFKPIDLNGAAVNGLTASVAVTMQ
jgi:hypothetical protein